MEGLGGGQAKDTFQWATRVAGIGLIASESTDARAGSKTSPTRSTLCLLASTNLTRGEHHETADSQPSRLPPRPTPSLLLPLPCTHPPRPLVPPRKTVCKLLRECEGRIGELMDACGITADASREADRATPTAEATEGSSQGSSGKDEGDAKRQGFAAMKPASLIRNAPDPG